MHVQKLLICELQFLEFISICGFKDMYRQAQLRSRSFQMYGMSVHPSVVSYKGLRMHIYKYIYIYIRLCKVKLGRKGALH